MLTVEDDMWRVRADFLQLVQTMCIVYDMKHNRDIAAGVLAEAQHILPQTIYAQRGQGVYGLYEAAYEYVRYQYGLDDAPKPDWVPG